MASGHTHLPVGKWRIHCDNIKVMGPKAGETVYLFARSLEWKYKIAMQTNKKRWISLEVAEFCCLNIYLQTILEFSY